MNHLTTVLNERKMQCTAGAVHQTVHLRQVRPFCKYNTYHVPLLAPNVFGETGIPSVPSTHGDSHGIILAEFSTKTAKCLLKMMRRPYRKKGSSLLKRIYKGKEEAKAQTSELRVSMVRKIAWR